MGKKRLLLLLIIFICSAFIIVGCTKKVMYVGSNVGNQVKGSYQYFDGTETKTVNLKENEIMFLEYQSVVESGELMIQFFDPNKNVVVEIETNKSGTKGIVADQSGRYSFVITGKSTKGSFDLRWEIE